MITTQSLQVAANLRPLHHPDEVAQNDLYIDLEKKVLAVCKPMTHTCFYSCVKSFWCEDDEAARHSLPLSANSHVLALEQGWKVFGRTNIVGEFNWEEKR